MRALLAYLLLGCSLATADTLLIKSVDGGRTWTDIDPGPPDRFLAWFSVDPGYRRINGGTNNQFILHIIPTAAGEILSLFATGYPGAVGRHPVEFSLDTRSAGEY